MIQTDFILVRKDTNTVTRIPLSESAKTGGHYSTNVYYESLETIKRDLTMSGYTVTVLDRATMTRDEQREVFMLTRDASFLSSEYLEWLMGRSELVEAMEKLDAQRLKTIDKLQAQSVVFEYNLPETMSKHLADEWYEKSIIWDGVRVGFNPSWF